MTTEQATPLVENIPDNRYDQNTSKGRPGYITILEPSLRYGFTHIPRPVLKAHGLSRNAKTLYALLLDYAWQSGSCFPGQARLAADLDISIDSVRRDLEELRHYGLISWQRRPGLATTNIYYIHRLSDCSNLNLPDNSSDSAQDAHVPPAQDAYMPVAHAADLPPVQSASMPHKHDSVMNKTQAEKPQYNTAAQGQQTKTPKRVVVMPPKQERKKGQSSAQTEGAVITCATDITATMVALMPEVLELVGIGWQQAKAIAFVEHYGEERVSRHLEALRFLQRRRPDLVRDPAAWVRKAVEEDWPTPVTAAPTEAPRNAFFATSRENSENKTDLPQPTPITAPLAENSDMAHNATLDVVWQELVPRLRPALNVAKALWLSKAHLTSDDPAVLAWATEKMPIPATTQPRLRLVLNRRWQLNEMAQTDIYYVEMLLNDRLGVPVHLLLDA